MPTRLSSRSIQIGLFKAFPTLLEGQPVPADFGPTVDKLFTDNNAVLDCERVNILLNLCHVSPLSQAFFDFYFGKPVRSVDTLVKSITRFIKDGLWHFGSIELAYEKLRTLENINEYFESHEFSMKEFSSRLPWRLIEDIPAEDRGYLGYVSGQRPFHEQELMSLAEAVVQELENNPKEYSGIDKQDIRDKVFQRLAHTHPELKGKHEEISKLSSLKELDLFSDKSLEKNRAILHSAKDEVARLIDRVDRLREIGRQNQTHFVRNVGMIDVYVATSMRDDKEYRQMYEFVKNTFNSERVEKLNLRYFDPTLCYCKSRLDKGIIECLLVRSAKVTIYCAQDGDTFGKDSELAATLCQGKPAIVYVPEGEEHDRRAMIFKEFHPLGLQVGIYDGVARGVIVVRTPEECATILSEILTNSLQTDISFEESGVVLRERRTKSVVRVCSGWRDLSHAFWQNYNPDDWARSGVPGNWRLVQVHA